MGKLSITQRTCSAVPLRFNVVNVHRVRMDMAIAYSASDRSVQASFKNTADFTSVLNPLRIVARVGGVTLKNSNRVSALRPFKIPASSFPSSIWFRISENSCSSLT